MSQTPACPWASGPWQRCAKPVFAAQGNDRAILARLWSRADDLAAQALRQGGAPASLPISRLHVRAEVERWQGNNKAAVATLRESIGLGRSAVQAARSHSTSPRDPGVLDAYGWLDGSMGMLTYALVRDGRPQEAIHVAESNLALWRAGQLSDGLGARWDYRLASSLQRPPAIPPRAGSCPAVRRHAATRRRQRRQPYRLACAPGDCARPDPG
ncbi:hypothetical protein [Candidatus Aalborgicola defluviihabitans]|uniref:hypothetical protein n=1 Tax=Candidatus Aalborgicola defluviihabitans TaxID=3386187 RepID=UPI001EB4BEFF|nr:hypothetical protein [Burkholderiales bacterium]